MQPLTAEWVDKAEGDFATLLREIRARKRPNYDSACFHAQQCTEKYLKARLQEAGIPFGKTHDLPALLHLLSAIEPFPPLPEQRRIAALLAEQMVAVELARAAAKARLAAARALPAALLRQVFESEEARGGREAP